MVRWSKKRFGESWYHMNNLHNKEQDDPYEGIYRNLGMNTGNSSTKHVADTIYFCIGEIKYYLSITR